jgi:hypothetical protein
LFDILELQQEVNMRNKSCFSASVNPVKLEDIVISHFSALKTLELRSAAVLYGNESNLSPGTIVIQGSWPRFPSLTEFKFHGNIISSDIQNCFLDACIPTAIALDGLGWDSLLRRPASSLYSLFCEAIASLSWKNTL